MHYFWIRLTESSEPYASEVRINMNHHRNVIMEDEYSSDEEVTSAVREMITVIEETQNGLK